MTRVAMVLNLFLESMNMQLPMRMIKFSLTPSTSCCTYTSRLHCGQNHAFLAKQQLQRRKAADSLSEMKARKTSSMMKGTNCTDSGMGCRLQIEHIGSSISPIGQHLFCDIFNLPHYYYTRKRRNMLLVIIALVWLGNSIECGPGVPILTRIPNGKGSYTVALQCLCPIDYHGMQCKHHRRLSCYLQTQQITPQYIDSSNFQDQKEITVTISTDCYIQLDNQNFISFVEYFLRKEIQSQMFEYQLESGRQGGEIIWANDTSLLDENGFVLYQEGYSYTGDENGTRKMSAQDEQTILNGKGKYEFQYKSEFLGFPFTDSQFTIIPDIYKIIGNKRVLPQQQVQFTNYNEYVKAVREKIRKERQAREYIQNLSWSDVFNELNGFSVEKVVKQVEDARKEVQEMYRMDVVPLIKCAIVANVRDETEFKMLKGEFKLIETYTGKSTYVVSINSAVARIPVDVEGIGEATIYNNNFYKAPSRLLFFFLAFLGLALLYLLFRCYKSWKLGKLRQIKKQVQEQYEQRQLG